MIFQTLQSYISQCILSFDSIPEERKVTLKKISQFIAGKVKAGETANLIYVCTHNSRRSHFGQIWGKTAAAFYGIHHVNTFSAGTEATAFNPNAIRAAIHAGFQIAKIEESKNPTYAVSFSNDNPPLRCFSKTYKDDSIPKDNLCAVMTCTEADGNCPLIPGTELRVSCPYDDPKAFDGTSQQEEKYNERCRQVAMENLYLFSLINK
jgi:arsenate reductase (thioredoxin)